MSFKTQFFSFSLAYTFIPRQFKASLNLQELVQILTNRLIPKSMFLKQEKSSLERLLLNLKCNTISVRTTQICSKSTRISSSLLRWDSQMRAVMVVHLYRASHKQMLWLSPSLSHRWVPRSRESFQQHLRHLQL